MSNRRAEKRRQLKAQSKKRRRRIQYRLRDRDWEDQSEPMFSAQNIHYEIADRARGLDAGGIGLIHKMVRKLGLVDAIDSRLELLKVHLPYHESDHVLNICYNILTGGTCLEDLELRRNDEVYLDALGAQRIPDPTTEGDFCRRFDEPDVEALMEAINESRLLVWKEQPDSFFEEAVLDADGTLAPTTGECKEGTDFSYNGVWGYHPLVISLANTGEPLFLENRSGNRPSQEGAAPRIDQSIDLCRKAGFQTITVRGDTDFSLTRHLDRWDDCEVRFVFGYDARQNLQEIAENLPKALWKRLVRPLKYEVQTECRVRRRNVKEEVIKEREYKNIRLDSEHVAEFDYQPTFPAERAADPGSVPAPSGARTEGFVGPHCPALEHGPAPKQNKVGKRRSHTETREPPRAPRKTRRGDPRAAEETLTVPPGRCASPLHAGYLVIYLLRRG